MVQRVDFVQSEWKDKAEWAKVLQIADALTDHMNLPATKKAIDAANQPGKKSSEVQNVLLEFLIGLGFKDEAKGLFQDYPNAGLRPDYFLHLDQSGIILEVERGKTNMNNMDFLDFWKCHICEHAHYLFLLVPETLKQGKQSGVSRPFETTQRHLEPFFRPINYTNVRGVALFGY